LIHAKKWSTGLKWPKLVILGLLGGYRRPFLLGKDLALPQHTSILTFMVEFHFYLAKKMVNWVSNWLKRPKLAVFGHFEGCRGP